MKKFVVALHVQVVIEANSSQSAQNEAWVNRAALLKNAKAEDVTSAETVREAP